MRRLLLLVSACVMASKATADPAVFRQWGKETMAAIDRDLWMPERKLYAEHADIATGKPDHPSFMWGVGVQLTALAAASRHDPGAYLERTRTFADAIQSYWLEHDGISGFDVQPGPKDSDRYYDDNAWVVLALIEVHEVTKDPVYLQRAVATFKFVMSGEDDKLGGGLYWREAVRDSKNTCTNAPAIVCALRLHQLTKDPEYLKTADRIHRWTLGNLQDKDGLFFDSSKLDGRVDPRKFSYNSALMIRAECLFHEITGDAKFLQEAQRIARAAELQWVRWDGAMTDSGRFAHLLLESFLELHGRDKDPHWKEIAEKTINYLHSTMRNEGDRYPSRWDRMRPGPMKNEVMLLNQASVARAYWMTAEAAD